MSLTAAPCRRRDIPRLSSIAAALFNIANADAASQRQAMSSYGADASNTARQADESSVNVVLSAQGQNALAAEQAAQASAANLAM